MSIIKLFLSLFLLSLLNISLVADAKISDSLKEKKLYPMGKKIYNKKCKDIDIHNYHSHEDMLNSILTEELCGIKNSKYAEALSYYLWDVKRLEGKEIVYETISSKKDEKCPICGMFLYKYPRWTARLEYDEKSFGFDGIKDMMKFYFDEHQGVTRILVQNYYNQKTLNAKEAYFVIGSDIYGPMGNELIAFKDEASARRFSLDHRAKKVLSFDEITPKIVYGLDE